MRQIVYISALIALAIASLTAIQSRAKETKVSDHFDGKRFFNPDGQGNHSSSEVIKMLWSRKPAKWPKQIENKTYPPPQPVIDGEHISTTFIGHASFLIQIKGWNIITDPQFSERASPVSWAGPKRVRKPGVAYEDLPRIDLVLISHNHYDHMDVDSLKRLQQSYRPIFLTGLGNKKFLESLGLTRVEEMDWWDGKPLDNGSASLTVTFTPAQHFSARGLFDKNETLWGGFAIHSKAGQVFFAGDTAYGTHFSAIRERLGIPDLALIPIGAYEPRWFMKTAHVNPEEAVQAHVDLGSRQSIGMHFGTFQLTDEPIDEPATRLKAEIDRRGLRADTFKTIDFGETFLQAEM